MTFGILGPVEVRAPGRSPAALPPSVRALLARLVLAAGRVVSVDSLTDALWGEDLPADATNALQIRVSKLRRALGAAGIGGDVLVTRAPGYQLAIPAESVDAHRFEHLVRHARARASTGQVAAALEFLDEALRLWRGPALADVGETQWALAESARLEELRLGSVEDRLELLLEAGRHVEAVADLERSVADNPLRERLHRLLMLGLYRSGRQAEALAAYQALRHHLADELGIDPSPELQALAEAILRQQVPSPPATRPTPSPDPLVPAAPSTDRVTPADPSLHRVAPPIPSTDRVRPAGPSLDGPAPATEPSGTRQPAGPAATSRGGDALPQRLSSVIGRHDDVETALRRLHEARTVTLTGPGGVGKTTLAMEVARRADETLADRVRLVRLAALEPGTDVAETFATQLGLVTDASGTTFADAVVEHLVESRALLVVDNCEHVIDDVAVLVERLVESCPGLTVLATSREALAVPGEIQLAVSPLAVPEETGEATAIPDTPAVQLFLDRARAVRPSFALDSETAPVVASICRRLDGMPLAIELAAARVKALSVTDIAARLKDRFSLLTAGPRTSEARHRTLRATLDWSHDLLSGAERRLLRRLAVFRGGWTLTAAEEVCGFDGIEPGEVLDLLLRLVDRSLVVPDPSTGRFRMLVTVREYAASRLAEAGEAEACRSRFLDHYVRLAEEHGPHVRSGGDSLARLTEEYDNLRAAVDHSLDPAGPDVEAGLRLAGALVWFWNYGLRHEGTRALSALLESGGGAPAARARALQGIGALNVYYPTPRSRAAARQSLTLFEEIGDRHNAAISRLVVAWAGQYGGDAEEYRAMIAQSRAELGDSEDGWWWAITHYLDAFLSLRLGEFDASAAQWRHSRDLLRRTSDRILDSAIAAHLGISLREAGHHAEASAVLREAIEDARRFDSPHGLPFALAHLAHTLLDVGEDDEVPALLAEADEVARRMRNPRCQAWAAWGRARIACGHGDAARAAQECRRALALLEEREFPWARARLWSLMADCAEAAGLPEEAEQARHTALTVDSTPAAALP
ncbi:AfsR/SARP family transcriptional regulator [Sphaerisporangium album]|uniref:AfsR/SARP family transcriptional regulator n=1 Tax=Sphaerisporangium album TaxID=509200 RepID=UPI0011C04DFB|nr:BTAD domain-containing putative transcriptional regulator [Sphaerisporangium album]